MKRYDPKKIEPKWQKVWDETQVYKANLHSSKPKYIAMSMFNYPSGAGIHIGHAMNYTISDVLARFKRQQGYESYHPVGWDAFGLPAENYAIKAGVSPQQSMATIIPNYHRQYKAMGWSNDWSKEIATHEPIYYKWTQWIFSEMYRNKLAYQDSRMQWWCTKCQTVLANEQVIDGKCWRHDASDDPIVEKKEVKQWFFKITDYADELLDATDDLDWTESVKLAQKNWIGRSVGAEIDFAIDGHREKLKVFTTRPDTLFGVTFIVLAPEHPLVEKLTTDEHRANVHTYEKATQIKTEVERQDTNRTKTGVFTGSYAINPVNDQKIPIWLADYVLEGYGTGAIMAVPGHDERDRQFAKKFDLPIKQVVAPSLLDHNNPPREGRENTNRNIVICLIKHPSEDLYLTLRWKKFDWHNFVMGGIEEGEAVEAAGPREIEEETGYADVRLLKILPMVGNNKFYAAHKDVNRNIFSNVALFQLNSLKQVATKREAHEEFETEWVTPAQLPTLQPIAELPYILEWLEKGDLMFTGEGVLINSGHYDGLTSSAARDKIVADLAKKDQARDRVNYRMHDWSVSRQRYWGAPIPIIHCPDHGAVLVPDEDLPVVLPELKDFQPSGDGRSALARATEWLKAPCPECGKEGERETDTLDTYICSSWYMLRYFDPTNKDKIFDSALVNKWMPIDFYNGADHATAHMIYARFVTRFFYKQGLVDNPEPFKKFLFNGKITAHDGQMFSKSKGNGVDPLEIINDGYGADALRTYLMFASPLELWTRWDPQGVPGAYRFLSRIWTLVGEFLADKSVSGHTSPNVQRLIHQTIKKVTEDIEHQRYNTAIAAMMQCVNELYKAKADEGFSDKQTWHFALESMVQLVAPFAPHISEELWYELGNTASVHVDGWPTWDEALLKEETLTIVVQVNGKVRATLLLESDVTKQQVEAAALADDHVKQFVTGAPKRVVYIPGRLINIVV